MVALVPTVSNCYSLNLPSRKEDPRLNLDVRTGSASTLIKSLVFTFGGLATPLEIGECSPKEIEKNFAEQHPNERLSDYLSGELFYLNLIQRQWNRVEVKEGRAKPKPRLFHEISIIHDHVLVFGGLIVEEVASGTMKNGTHDKTEILKASNSLWDFNTLTGEWSLLHDGSDYESNLSIPNPRYFHKMTPFMDLSFVDRPRNYGIMIAGGRDNFSNPIYTSVVFDLIERAYVPIPAFHLEVGTVDLSTGKEDFISDQLRYLSLDYKSNVLVNYHYAGGANSSEKSSYSTSKKGEIFLQKTRKEIVYVYGMDNVNSKYERKLSPVIAFEIKKEGGRGVLAPLKGMGGFEKKLRQSIGQDISSTNVPYNLSYPVGGFFGQNLVITGFLPGGDDIVIFIYNICTLKWSRLKVFCDHEHGSHKSWGGFTWQSHHKVILLGGMTPRKTSGCVRYFTLLNTIALPITNIAVTSEMYSSQTGYDFSNNTLRSQSLIEGNADSSSVDSSDSKVNPSSGRSDDEREKDESHKNNDPLHDKKKTRQCPISFNDYVDYAAPKTSFTNINSVFRPSAITLGRNALDRYGDLISDFELISRYGDRIPVSLRILEKRWGGFFIRLLTNAYVQAVYNFKTTYSEQSSSHEGSKFEKRRFQNDDRNLSELYSVDSSSSERSGSHVRPETNLLSKLYGETPHFRSPFNDASQLPYDSKSELDYLSYSLNVASPPDRGDRWYPEKDGSASICSSIDSHPHDPLSKVGVPLLPPDSKDLPPQLPLCSEQVPPSPSGYQSYRNPFRKGSSEYNSPRSSHVETVSALRNIHKQKSPRHSHAYPVSSVAPQSKIKEEQSSISNQQKPVTLAAGQVKCTDLRTFSGDSTVSNLPASLTSSPNKKISKSDDDIGNSIAEKKRSPVSLNASSRPNDLSFNDTPKNYKSDTDEGLLDRFLNYNLETGDTFRMDSRLIPRKLYMPHTTQSLQAFCDYLYTGQVGNKWLFSPTTLDTLIIAKRYQVPLLYDLVSEVLFGIVGRKEVLIINEAVLLKQKFDKLHKFNIKKSSSMFDMVAYNEFLHILEEGDFDIGLLRRASMLNNKFSKAKSKPDVSDKGDHSETGHNRESSNSAEDGEDDSNLELFGGDYVPNAPPPGAKSVFDKRAAGRSGEQMEAVFEKFKLDGKKELESVDGERRSSLPPNLTLEHILLGDSETFPFDILIDMIYETASLTNDVKLLVRSSNVKYMSEITERSRKELQNILKENNISLDDDSVQEKSDSDNLYGADTNLANEWSLSRVSSTSSLASQSHSEYNPRSSAMAASRMPSSGFIGQVVHSLKNRHEHHKAKRHGATTPKHLSPSTLLSSDYSMTPSDAGSVKERENTNQHTNIAQENTNASTQSANAPIADRVRQLSHGIFWSRSDYQGLSKSNN